MNNDVSAQQVLQELLTYEGGEMQSMNECMSCSFQNRAVLKVADKYGIILDTSVTGVNDYK